MRRGTTPTHEFEIIIDGTPLDLDLIDEVEIVYCQHGIEVLKKNKSMCSISGNIISVTLTQEETFLFTEFAVIEVQVRVLTNLGTVPACEILKLNCERCLSGEVLG